MSAALYCGLKRAGLLYDVSIAAGFSAQLSYFNAFLQDEPWFRALPVELRCRYALCLSMNCVKFSLAAQCFRWSQNLEAFSVAASFILAGCILDDMIDNEDSEVRQLALRKLNWGYCSDYFIWFQPMREVHVIDQLYSFIGAFLEKKRCCNPEAYEYFLALLKRAVIAECGSNDRVNQTLATDKSTLFTVLGFLLALYGNHTPEELSAFYLAGDLFRRMDDLCDFESDRDTGHVNSLRLEDGVDEVELVEKELRSISSGLGRLEGLTDSSFGLFIRYELQSWTLSNPYLYQKTIEVPKCQTL